MLLKTQTCSSPFPHLVKAFTATTLALDAKESDYLFKLLKCSSWKTCIEQVINSRVALISHADMEAKAFSRRIWRALCSRRAADLSARRIQATLNVIRPSSFVMDSNAISSVCNSLSPTSGLSAPPTHNLSRSKVFPRSCGRRTLLSFSLTYQYLLFAPDYPWNNLTARYFTACAFINDSKCEAWKILVHITKPKYIIV